MRYVSTRGGAPEVGFVEAFLRGLAPDGGLYTPEAWPRISTDQIAAFAFRPYAEVAATLLGLFSGGEISPRTVAAVTEAAYARFAHPAVAPLRQIGPDRFVLELFHGPTLAFKDIAMQLLAGLYEDVLARRGETLTIVCATSGDTGGAAVEAFGGRSDIRLVVLFPEGRVSDVQRRFMTTGGHANVRPVAVAGDFDACQAILKNLLADGPFARETRLSAVNSINIARIVAQSVYYFTAATALGAPGRAVSFVVPTGNFGDAFAAFAARRMGLPIERVLVATNGNDIVARALETGVYRRSAALATQSPAMDIQVASNFERLYFECVGRDGVETAGAFAAFAASGEMRAPAQAHVAMREAFDAAAVGEAQTAQAMRDAWLSDGRLVDPHTAVALAAERRAPGGGGPWIVLSTAHPAKFPEAVMAATGVCPEAPPSARGLAGRPEHFDRLAADSALVRDYVRAFAAA